MTPSSPMMSRLSGKYWFWNEITIWWWPDISIITNIYYSYFQNWLWSRPKTCPPRFINEGFTSYSWYAWIPFLLPILIISMELSLPCCIDISYRLAVRLSTMTYWVHTMYNGFELDTCVSNCKRLSIAARTPISVIKGWLGSSCRDLRRKHYTAKADSSLCRT